MVSRPTVPYLPLTLLLMLLLLPSTVTPGYLSSTPTPPTLEQSQASHQVHLTLTATFPVTLPSTQHFLSHLFTTQQDSSMEWGTTPTNLDSTTPLNKVVTLLVVAMNTLTGPTASPETNKSERKQKLSMTSSSTMAISTRHPLTPLPNLPNLAEILILSNLENLNLNKNTVYHQGERITMSDQCVEYKMIGNKCECYLMNDDCRGFSSTFSLYDVRFQIY